MQNIYCWLVYLHRGGTWSLTVVFCSLYLRALLNNMPMGILHRIPCCLNFRMFVNVGRLIYLQSIFCSSLPFKNNYMNTVIRLYKIKGDFIFEVPIYHSHRQNFNAFRYRGEASHSPFLTFLFLSFSVSQNPFAHGPLLDSKNNHGSSHSCSRKNSARKIGIQNWKFISHNWF